MGEIILELKSVQKKYFLGKIAVPALKDVSIRIGPGELIGIVGASGSGKSTLLNVMGCIDRADAGEVILMGHSLSDLSDDQLSLLRNQNLGFVFQSFNLIPVLTVRENIEIPLLLRNLAQDERDRRVNEMASAVGLESYLNNRPDNLSGGQRQRVAIARALVGAPQLVLADEPTANLDSENAEKIISLILRLGVTLNTTFVIASHDERLLRQVKRVVHIKDGVLQ